MLARTENDEFLRPGQPPIQRAEQRRRTVRVLSHHALKDPEDPAGPLIIPLLAREREEPQQDRCRDRIAGWNRSIGAGLHSLNQRLVVVTGKEAPPSGLIPKMRQETFCHGAGLVEVPA